MREISGSAQKNDMMEMLGEAVACVEVIRSTTRSAEEQATVDPENDVMYPTYSLFKRGAPSVRCTTQSLSTCSYVPAAAVSFNSPSVSLNSILRLVMRLNNRCAVPASLGARRPKLFTLARDICGSEFGARHTLYEMNDAGERSSLLARIQREYSRKPYYTNHLNRFLEGL